MLKRNNTNAGFTLVELLIVIAIIGILAGLAIKSISAVRESTDAAITETDVSSLANALEQYLQDEGTLPGQGARDVDEDTNQFPALYRALFGERAPKGPGGRNAPYLKIKEDKVIVWDDDLDDYREAKRSELNDDDVEKFMADSWGKPLIYRANKGKSYEPYMHNRYGADIYSAGPDSIDQTAEGSDEDNDDIGNW